MFIKGDNNMYIVQDDRHDVIGIFNSMINLGVEEFITMNYSPNEHIDSYCQTIGYDFKLSDMHDFIEKKILKSVTFKNNNEIKNDNQISLHVRCSDYLDAKKNNFHDCFDREVYLNKALSTIDCSINEITVFSDDIELVRTKYGKKLSERFDVIEYADKGNAEDDLIRMSLFKNKILWNSTYSYWSAFIGDVIYKNNEHNVLVPNKFSSIENSMSRINPKWTVIEV